MVLIFYNLERSKLKTWMSGQLCKYSREDFQQQKPLQPPGGVRNKRRYGGISSSVGEDSKKSMAIGSRRRLSQDFSGKIKPENTEQRLYVSFSYPQTLRLQKCRQNRQPALKTQHLSNKPNHCPEEGKYMLERMWRRGNPPALLVRM